MKAIVITKERFQADTWCIIYEDKENILVAFFPWSQVITWIQVEKKTKLACPYF